MNPSSNSLYTTNFGQGTPMLQITPGRNCRLWPYLREPGCTRTIAQCKSNAVYGIPAQAFQGSPVNYTYNLSGEAKACDANIDEEESSVPTWDIGAVREDYIASVNIYPDQGFKRCTTGRQLTGGCKCQQDGSADYHYTMP